MLDPPLTADPLAYWKGIAEITKAVVESLAILAGSLALIKWFTERHDRATDVLFQLETRFQDPQIQKGCRILEEESEYLKSAPFLELAVRSSANLWPDSPITKKINGFGEVASLANFMRSLVPESSATAETSPPEALASLDKLLRFYIVMHGFRKARQVPDAALRTCYRYWLAHYYHPRRPAFRAYVDHFFPTLRNWLACEKRWYKRSPSRPFRFFRAKDFWNTRQAYFYEQLKRATAGRVLVIAGAGLSAESGIPTFRGRGGLWRGVDAKELATQTAFNADPEKVWTFYRDRRNDVLSHAPNNAHRAIVALAARVRDASDFLMITQNVDHYEIDAGLSADKVIQIHGDLLNTRCFDSSCRYQRRESKLDMNKVDSRTLCPVCGKLLRPDVVWFDEDFRPGDEDRVDEFLSRGPCDAVFVIGTNATFSYIADWALTAVGAKGWLVEINTDQTDISRFAHKVYRGKAGKVLPKLIKNLSKGEPQSRLKRG